MKKPTSLYLKLFVPLVVILGLVSRGQTTLTAQSASTNGCVTTGCNGELCVDESIAPVASSCVVRPWHACLREFGTCERQPDDNCSWTPTEELNACILDSFCPKDQNGDPVCPTIAVPDCDPGFVYVPGEDNACGCPTAGTCEHRSAGRRPSTTSVSCLATDLNADGTVDLGDIQALLGNVFSTNQNRNTRNPSSDKVIDINNYPQVFADLGKTSICN